MIQALYIIYRIIVAVLALLAAAGIALWAHLRSRRMLESFHEEIISRYAWRGTSWSSFRSNGASSVERAAEKANGRMRQDKTYICSLLHIAPEEFDRQYCGRWETPLQRGCKEP